MSADAYADAISTILTANGYTNVIRNQPTYRDYDTTDPIVEISPVGKTDVKRFAFNTINNRQTYQAVYLYQNALNPATRDAITAFKTMMVKKFAYLPTQLKTAGAWDCRLDDNVDYDRGLLPKGWLASSCSIHVSYITATEA